MHNLDGEPILVSFECEMEIPPPGTPAGPRPMDRPRALTQSSSSANPEFRSFDCVPEELAVGTPAAPRPIDRPRAGIEPLVPTASEDVFAQELAHLVLEYVKSRPEGLTAEQLAAVVQQLLSRRSA